MHHPRRVEINMRHPEREGGNRQASLIERGVDLRHAERGGDGESTVVGRRSLVACSNW